MNQDSTLVSVIIPVHNEENNLNRNIKIIIDHLDSTNKLYEIILVDDGSFDNTWKEIMSLSDSFCTIVGIKLSRNFGKEAAMFAGLNQCKGGAVIVMDSDLEHPPKLISEMIYKWEKENCLIVEGIKRSRSDKGILYVIVANFYNSFFKRITGLDLTNSSDFKLMDRIVVNELLKMGEVNTFFRGMVTWTGYQKGTILFDVPSRHGDKSKFSLVSLSRLAITSLVSFSSSPLQLITITGVLFFIISIVGAIQTLVKYFSGDALEGFTTIILLILFTGSLIMLALGILGIYISKIFEEIKNRPRYIIENVITSN